MLALSVSAAAIAIGRSSHFKRVELDAALRGQLQPPGESRLEVPITFQLNDG